MDKSPIPYQNNWKLIIKFECSCSMQYLDISSSQMSDTEDEDPPEERLCNYRIGNWPIPHGVITLIYKIK